MNVNQIEADATFTAKLKDAPRGFSLLKMFLAVTLLRKRYSDAARFYKMRFTRPSYCDLKACQLFLRLEDLILKKREKGVAKCIHKGVTAEGGGGECGCP